VSRAGEGGVGYRQVLRSGQFTALLAARMLSDWGDHIARVAIAALMLEVSGSIALSAATFAVSWLPSIFGQALLGPYADRFPRRALLVVCDVLRAGLVLLLLSAVVIDVPLPAVLALLFVVELAGAPFYAATMALLADVFDDRREFMTAHALLRVLGQANQVVGLAVGGVVVAVLQVRGALLLDIVSFAVSGLLVAVFIRSRGAGSRGRPGLPGLWEDVRTGTAYLRRDVPLRSLLLLAWVTSVMFTAPEAVALGYAELEGASSRVGGLLLAAPAAGAVCGAWIVGRWPWRHQVRRILPLAALGGLPLLVVALEPSWPVALLLFAASGACGAFMVPLMSIFTVLAPEHLRGRLNGLAGAGFSAVTVVGFVVAGIVADLTSPAFTVTLAGAVTCAALAALWPGWPHKEIDRASEAAFS
jgi:MFS family permease